MEIPYFSFKKTNKQKKHPKKYAPAANACVWLGLSMPVFFMSDFVALLMYHLRKKKRIM
jgi:hypothetical protein